MLAQPFTQLAGYSQATDCFNRVLDYFIRVYCYFIPQSVTGTKSIQESRVLMLNGNVPFHAHPWLPIGSGYAGTQNNWYTNTSIHYVDDGLKWN